MQAFYQKAIAQKGSAAPPESAPRVIPATPAVDVPFVSSSEHAQVRNLALHYCEMCRVVHHQALLRVYSQHMIGKCES